MENGMLTAQQWAFRWANNTNYVEYPINAYEESNQDLIVRMPDRHVMSLYIKSTYNS